jgi:hypothetical protein
MTCLHCGATVTNGLALCELCQHYVKTALPYMAIYFRNLSRWKPGRAGSRPVPGSREPSSVATVRADRVWDTLDEASNALTTWARTLADDRPGRLAATIARILTFEEERCFRLMCALFERRLVTVATLGWAGEFVRGIDEQETILRGLTERVVPGWYAGGCRQPVGFDDDGAVLRCGASTYVVPGLTWVRCGGCGATTYARDHLDTVLDEARGWVARPMRLAEAIVALVDTEMSIPRLHKRISKWGERTTGKNITAIRKVDDDGDEVGPKRYRMGDVLDLLRSEGETRLHDTTVTVPAEAS